MVYIELQCYADSCAENRSLWQERVDHLAQAIESVHLVQPVVEAAATDERFRTLFPLSLPSALVGATCLEPGPSLSPTPPHQHISSPIDLTSHTRSSNQSPTAKAMRAVYHHNLLNQKHRSFSWLKTSLIGFNIPPNQFPEGRRMSTPDIALPSGIVV